MRPGVLVLFFMALMYYINPVSVFSLVSELHNLLSQHILSVTWGRSLNNLSEPYFPHLSFNIKNIYLIELLQV